MSNVAPGENPFNPQSSLSNSLRETVEMYIFPSGSSEAYRGNTTMFLRSENPQYPSLVANFNGSVFPLKHPAYRHTLEFDPPIFRPDKASRPPKDTPRTIFAVNSEGAVVRFFSVPDPDPESFNERAMTDPIVVEPDSDLADALQEFLDDETEGQDDSTLITTLMRPSDEEQAQLTERLAEHDRSTAAANVAQLIGGQSLPEPGISESSGIS